MAKKKPNLGDMLKGLTGGSGAPGAPDLPGALLQAFSPGDSDDQQSGIDQLQFVLDVVGTVDPTPVSDAANAAISIARAFKSESAEERSKHISNALISSVSMVPYVGDLAKLTKYGGKKASKIGAKAATGDSPPITSLGDVSRGSVPPGTPSPPESRGESQGPGGRTISDVVGEWLSKQGIESEHRSGDSEQRKSASSSSAAGSQARTSPAAPPGSPPPPSTPRTSGTSPPPPNPTNPGSGPSQIAIDFAQGLAAGTAAGAIMGSMAPPPPQLPGRRHSWMGFFGGPAAGHTSESMGPQIDRTFQTAQATLNPFVPLSTKLTTAGRALYDSIVELPGAISEWAEKLKMSQQHLAEFNGTIAVAYLESERRDILRGIASGQRTAATTRNLTEAMSDLKDEIQPIRDEFTNFTNIVATAMLRTLETGVDFAGKNYAAFKVANYKIGALVTIGEMLRSWVTEKGKDGELPPGMEMMDHFRRAGMGDEDPETKPPRYI